MHTTRTGPPGPASTRMFRNKRTDRPARSGSDGQGTESRGGQDLRAIRHHLDYPPAPGEPLVLVVYAPLLPLFLLLFTGPCMSAGCRQHVSSRVGEDVDKLPK